MYDTIINSASFWQSLIEFDLEICRCVQSAGCPWCGGTLDRGDYARKPRGIPEALAEAFSTRLSTCCRCCRKRVTPPSVRFLGRKVYVGAIVILATMSVLVCAAAGRTLARWRAWWTTVLPTTTFWQAACGRLVPAVQTGQLPGALLERFEQSCGGVVAEALEGALQFLQPVSSRLGEHFDGRQWTGGLAQKMHFDRNLPALLRSNQIPTRLN